MEFKIANENKNDDNVEDKKKNINNDEFKKKMKKMAIYIMGGFVILMVILAIMSLFTKKNYSYDEVENILKSSAINYFADHKKNLPVNANQIVEITDKTLTSSEYMKSLDEYLKSGVSCSGKVVVRKVDNNYSYTPYLDCGSSYSSKPLYTALTKKVVTSGDGIYKTNNGYVFRGENVNNYVQLDKRLWRVVKINSDNSIILLLDGSYIFSYPWDDRYNKELDYNAGINDYNASRVKSYLNDIYNDNDEDDAILSKSDRLRLVKFNLCIGSRSIEDSSKDNSLECSQTVANQKIGLLTVSDYMNASLDASCNNATSYSCQNYNYLVTVDSSWWLGTSVAGTTDEVFSVGDVGVVNNESASGYADIRPIVSLSNTTFISGGKGTKNNPYKLK